MKRNKSVDQLATFLCDDWINSISHFYVGYFYNDNFQPKHFKLKLPIIIFSSFYFICYYYNRSGFSWSNYWETFSCENEHFRAGNKRKINCWRKLLILAETVDTCGKFIERFFRLTFFCLNNMVFFCLKGC